MTQLPFMSMLPNSDWTPPRTFPNISAASLISIDFETRDPDIGAQKGPGWPTHNGEIVGVSVAVDGWSGYYPIRHEGGGNVEEEPVLRWISDVMKLDIPKVFHNAVYDCGWAGTEGVTINGQLHDTQYMAALLDEHRDDYSLDAICQDYGVQGKDESLLKKVATLYAVNPKAGLYKLPAKYVGAYAQQDAVATLSLYQKLAPFIVKEELTRVYDLERALIPVLVGMRKRGVRVDEEKSAAVKKMLKARISDVHRQLLKDWGLSVDIWSSKSLTKVFDRLKIPYPARTQKGNPSFAKDALKNVRHPVIQLIQQARTASTTVSLVCEGMIESYAVNGRIHCEMHPLRRDEEEGKGGTIGGRFSSTHPNLQQVTKRNKEIAALVRAFFLPEVGESWIKHDYSQQEYRLIVHYAVLGKYRGWELAAKAYENPDTDFHAFVAELTGLERDAAKNINFGIAYTMGIHKLAAQLGTSYESAKEIMDRYHKRLPFVRKFVRIAASAAGRRGWIKTILGRRCRFPKYELDIRRRLDESDFRIVVNSLQEAKERWPGTKIRRAFTHTAVNRVVQGSAADMTKVAMLECYKAGFLPLLQVHDELDFSGDPSSVRPVNTIMCNAIPLKIPMKVDSSIGENWAELKKWVA